MKCLMGVNKLLNWLKENAEASEEEGEEEEEEAESD